MKKTVAIFTVLLLSCSLAFAQQIRIDFDLISGKRQPNPAEAQAMRAEEASHPGIAKAMYQVQASIQILSKASGDFGGHKVEAMANLQQALFSLKKALYYRIYKDH